MPDSVSESYDGPGDDDLDLMPPETMAKHYGLTILRLIRQLPRDNLVRKDAEELLVRTKFHSLDSILREEEPAGKRCPKCDGQMHHTRLYGYRCTRGC